MTDPTPGPATPGPTTPEPISPAAVPPEGGAVDLVVVGAGPAGLAAAVTAVDAGLRVVVVDAGGQPGGQYWRHLDESLADGSPGADDEGAGHHDWQIFTRMRDRFHAARARGVLSYLPGTQVWFLEPPVLRDGNWTIRVTPVLDGSDATAADRLRTVRAPAVVLCPGGYDRQLPLPGWDLPGVMAAGGVQALLKGHRTLAGRRAVVAGTGPFLLPVAAGLAEAGAEVVAVCEAADLIGWVRHMGGALRVPAKAREGAEYARVLLRHKIAYRPRTVVTAVHGESGAEAVTVARVDRSGAVRPGTERRLEVDLVALGWGFTPSLELVVAAGAETRLDVDGSLVAVVDDDQRSTVRGIYVAGEATGVGGAVLAVLEGELAALAAAQDHSHLVPVAARRRRQRAIARARAFARTMHLAHPVPPRWPDWLTEDTTVCRCEEVTYGDICRVRDELGAVDAKTVKLMARPGMGWCQGRVCGFAVAHLAAAGQGRTVTADDLRPMAKKPLAAPVSLAELADLTDVVDLSEPLP